MLFLGELIAYLGGASFIILALSSWIGKIWANKFMKKQEAVYQKEIEGYRGELSRQLELLKSQNEKTNHISKTQFEAEFKIYQELSESSFLMLLDVSLLFPGLDTVPQDLEERKEFYKERYKNAQQSFVTYQNKFFQVAPFINESMYKLFDELREIGRLQVIWYPELVLEDHTSFTSELRKDRRECRERTKEMNEKHKVIIDKLREYLGKLKVIG